LPYSVSADAPQGENPTTDTSDVQETAATADTDTSAIADTDTSATADTDTSATADTSAAAGPTATLLAAPREGTPQPLTTPVELAEAAAGLARGTGPVAIDAERASGYRYSQRAYLVQLRRAGYGTVLIDPINLPDLTSIDAALSDAEWVLHAANQDLPCLAELRMRPRTLFDTELAGRLLGFERVALGTMLEQYLAVSLEKGHSAADWSTRPLPPEWLNYAALDVELLVELRDVLREELAKAGKLEWAEQEFLAVVQAKPAPPRAEPWRRTSGIQAIRTRSQLAVVRSLWHARDDLAASRDVAPGRVLPDSAILQAVRANPKQVEDLTALPIFNGPRQRRIADYWFSAIVRGQQEPAEEWPTVSQVLADPDGVPLTSRWRDRDPEAAARLLACKAFVTQAALDHHVLAQNLLAGEVIRKLCWRPVEPLTEVAVRERLAELRARPWQIELTAAGLTEVLKNLETDAEPVNY
jgi:ribonuclease D